MATFNATTNAAGVLSSSVAAAAAAAAAAEHFERSAAAAAAATFIVPSTSNSAPHLQLEPFVSAAPHFVASTPAGGSSHHHQHNTTSSSYTFVQIKREPCQVPEVTSNNCHQRQTSSATTTTQHHHGVGAVSSSVSASATSKTMSSSTLTTLVKIEPPSPKVLDMDKGSVQTLASAATVPSMTSTNNSVPIGIAVARKRQQETSNTLSSATLQPIQQSITKDMNCFGIRVADLGGVSAGCGNIFFTGNGDLMSGSTTAEELALNAAGVQTVNRAPSTFWQYPNALPIESVISMSPATVGLQYSRDANRGQVVLLPATAATLDPFQQAAAFVWPSYIPQNTTSAAAALQPPPNFIFPSMNHHSTLQPQSYATSLQLFGQNYLTAAAAAAAAAAATSTLCHHNQQTNSSTSSINLSLGTPAMGSCSTTSSSSRFLSISSASADSQKPHKSLPPPVMPLPPPPLIVPPATMKIEEWNATEFMASASASAAKTTTTTLSAATHQNHLVAAPSTLNYESRDKTTTTTTTTTNLLDLHGAAQALNLVRLPTPTTPATMENSLVSGANTPQMQPQLLFQTTSSSTPTLLNLSAALPRVSSATSHVLPSGITTTNFLNSTTTTLSATIGPPTPIADESALNFKTCSLDASQPPIVVGVPRVVSTHAQLETGPLPQMQDVNIQTDTPVCSEDENSSCPLIAQQAAASMPAGGVCMFVQNEESMSQEAETQQPLELTTNHLPISNENSRQEQSDERITDSIAECHKRKSLEEEEHLNQKVRSDISTSTRYSEMSQPLETMTGEVSLLPNIEPVTTTERTSPEDLTGLELLSNISTSSLAKNPAIRVKQEPIEHMDTPIKDEPSSLIMNSAENRLLVAESAIDPSNMQCVRPEVHSLLPPPPAVVEPLGGLNLLCALAEQRIQEEVQSSGSLFAPSGDNELQQRTTTTTTMLSQTFAFQHHQSPYRLDQAFPSMEGIELPTANVVGSSCEPAKRKKHKHSKSSKSSTSSKKSQRCGKKNKKKNSKEKRKHRLPSTDELDFNDTQLQDDLTSAFKSIDPNYKRFGNWPNPEEIFSIMETKMRLRLADITRQYRKKKRKLDEISKNKKMKKCSKLAAQQAIASLGLGGSTSLPLVSSSNGLGCGSTTTPSPLYDYKFAKFSSTSATGSATPSYLNPSSFLRFVDKKQPVAQFPPPDVDLSDDKDTITPSTSTTSIYKPVRLEPSALSAVENRGSALRLAQKHSSTEKTSHVIVCKERKLLNSVKRGADIEESHVPASGNQGMAQSQRAQSQSPPQRQPSAADRELLLTNDHLYQKETRVLTDMGGLFYAGIMKPLQPPDVYAITLDGERGNKSHIMSREEIFKDTILEVAPKSVESVPVGTRLCAYWSQQYRCLYPGRAIESESSDDDAAPHDFVSVEFDDGDSGRIRLQNIRLLLSDYPIAEYNDNPLYSLGKQKKSTVRSGNISDPCPPEQHIFATTATESHHSAQGSNMLPTSSEPGKEMFARRTGKKRNKSLKKKLQTTVSAVTTTTSAGESNECIKKHHKHKKRKKHKKHHHRKNVLGETERSAFTFSSAATATTTNSFVNKRELQAEEERHKNGDVDRYQTESAKHNSTAQSAENNVKLEPLGSTTSAHKVKAEHLDIEEETTSNLMSEVSDEAKADEEVEHNNSKGSKIAAFLPERQLWGWLGKAYRKAGVKGRARKQFYKTIKRGKETITVGDCAVFLSTGRPDRPYIGRIESMWETTSSNKVVRVRWFYHPEETNGCPKLKYPGALFESPHEDENDVQTISHHCAVLPFENYFAKFGADSKQYQSIYDNNDTYYLAGFYNPRTLVLKLQDDIPALEEQSSATTATATTTTTKDEAENTTV